MYENLSGKCGDSLVERNFGGIHVAMFYDRREDSVYVYYHDIKTDTEFVIDPPKFLAVDAYTHPIMYAEAALNGKSNPRMLVPAEVAA